MSEAQRPRFDDTASSKTVRKIKENPMVPIGMAGFFLAVAYGVRNFKNRPKNMSPSMYIMRFRVFAQGIAVGCMFLGIGYTIVKDRWSESHSTDTKK